MKNHISLFASIFLCSSYSIFEFLFHMKKEEYKRTQKIYLQTFFFHIRVYILKRLPYFMRKITFMFSSLCFFPPHINSHMTMIYFSKYVGQMHKNVYIINFLMISNHFLCVCNSSNPASTSQALV